VFVGITQVTEAAWFFNSLRQRSDDFPRL